MNTKIIIDDKMTRKDRERLFKRNEILIAATKLFAVKGFENTTLDEIAEASEFGKGTLYNYFQNKEDILKATLENILEDYSKMLSELNSTCDNIKDLITEVTKKMFEFSLSDSNSFNLLAKFRMKMCPEGEKNIHFDFMKKFKNINDSIFKKRIEEAIEKNEMRKVDSQDFLILYRCMIFPYIHGLTKEKNSNKIDIKRQTDFVLSVLFNGILIDK